MKGRKKESYPLFRASIHGLTDLKRKKETHDLLRVNIYWLTNLTKKGRTKERKK